MKILIGSPIRQKPKILNEFLIGLNEIESHGIDVHYCFVDDNINKDSSLILKKFIQRIENDNATIIYSKDIIGNKNASFYECNDITHFWDSCSVQKVADIKDFIIKEAINGSYDYLFLVDSDIVLDKRCLKHLISCNKDIISEVFWTQWTPNGKLEPQAFTMCLSGFLSNEAKEKCDYSSQFRIPGVYEVNGTGACTLISRNALCKGVCFDKIHVLDSYGEDRDFCIRASILGFKLYMDTTYPAYHIYRERYLDRVDEFKNNGFKFDMCQSYLAKKKHHFICKLISFIKRKIGSIKRFVDISSINRYYKKRKTNNNTIVCSMIVRNETNNYLDKVFDSIKNIVNYFVIIDDASTDCTVAECERLLHNIPHSIISNKKQMFSHEYKLRYKLFKETIKINPGWILFLDANEIIDNKSALMIKNLLEIESVDLFSFRLFDMWNDKEYRDDYLWNAHKRFWPFILRYVKGYRYKWNKKNQHCGRIPCNINFIQKSNVDIHVLHFGWASSEIRKLKYDRYMKYDTNGNDNNGIQQYESILDKNPNLVPYQFDE